jgi:hypothetical protein
VYSSTHSSLTIQSETFYLKIFTYSIVTNNRPIEDWDLLKITNMDRLFKDKVNCNPNIAKWDISKVTSFVS